MRSLSCLGVTVIFLLLNFACSTPVSQNGQGCPDGNLLVVNITESTFNSTAWSPTTNKVSGLLNDYCQVKFSECSLSSWNATRDSFQAGDIKMYHGYPQEVGKDLEILFYANLRSNSSTRVPSATLKKVLERNMSDISQAIGYTLKFKDCIVVEEKAEEIDHTLNYILIPIAFFILLLIAAVAYILHRHNKQMTKQREKQMRQEFLHKMKSKDAHGSKIREMQTAKADMEEKAKHTEESIRTVKEKPVKSERKHKPDDEIVQDKRHIEKVVADVNHVEDEGEPKMRRHKKRSSRKHRGESNQGYEDDENITSADGGDVVRGAENMPEGETPEDEKRHKKKRRSRRRHHRHQGESDEGYHEDSNGQKLSPDLLPPVVTHSGNLPRTLPPLSPASPVSHDTKM